MLPILSKCLASFGGDASSVEKKAQFTLLMKILINVMAVPWLSWAQSKAFPAHTECCEMTDIKTTEMARLNPPYRGLVGATAITEKKKLFNQGASN